MLEEYGKWVKNTTAATLDQRQQFYTQAYNMVLQVCQALAPSLLLAPA